MIRTIKHKWKKIKHPTEHLFKKCERCGLEQWYDFNFHTTVYYDPSTGVTTMFQKVPECKLFMNCDKT